jgi:hypothetical protein
MKWDAVGRGRYGVRWEDLQLRASVSGIMDERLGKRVDPSGI